MGKGIAYIRPFDLTLPLHPIEVELGNNKCCLETHNSSDTTVEFTYGHKLAYFDIKSKSLVQVNNSKHFLIEQYLHDWVTPATLSPKPLVYDKPIDPSKCHEFQHVWTQLQTILIFLQKMINIHG